MNTYRALIEALIANLTAPIDVADKLTKRALEMAREVMGDN